MRFVATWMELKTLIQSEVSWKQKDRQYRYHLHVESKTWHKWSTTKQKQIMAIENTRVVALGGRGSGMDWESEVSRWKLAFVVDGQWDPAVEHRELYPVTCDGSGWKIMWEKECIHTHTHTHTYISGSLFCTEDIDRTLKINYNKKKLNI